MVRDRRRLLAELSSPLAQGRAGYQTYYVDRRRPDDAG